MDTSFLSRRLTNRQRRVLKAAYYGLKGRVVRLVASYTPAQLEAKLRGLGIAPNDAVLMHSAFSQFNGFQGTPGQVIDCVMNVVGPQGHLFMLSLAYTGSARDYLTTGKPFDVRRTVSQMGIVTETFRRREGVLRSANPLHPVLARGPQAERIVAGHEELPYSCGPGSPFEKMLELDTKVLFFDVGFEVFGFWHYLEHRFKDRAPVPLYSPVPLEGTLIDREGRERKLPLYVFDREAIRRRNYPALKTALLEAGSLVQARIGNSKLMLVRAADALRCTEALYEGGGTLYKE